VQKAFRNDRDEEAMRLFVDGVLGKKGLDGVPAPRQQQMRENLSALKAQMLGSGFPPLHDEDVRSVTIPVLLLTGDQSPAFLHRLTERLNDLLPNAQTVRIPHASHLMHEENQAAVNAAILKFLTAQTPATS
jgi:pimeloyl-ACP methyl ester carboxylesterase